MFFYAPAGWAAMTLAIPAWVSKRTRESSRRGMIAIHVVELVLCFVGLIVLWRTGWGGAVSDVTSAWIYALLPAGTGVVLLRASRHQLTGDPTSVLQAARKQLV